MSEETRKRAEDLEAHEAYGPNRGEYTAAITVHEFAEEWQQPDGSPDAAYERMASWVNAKIRQAREEERARCEEQMVSRDEVGTIVAEAVSAERAKVNAEWVQACFDRMHCVVELPPDKALAMIERVVSNERVTALTHAREERDEAVRKAIAAEQEIGVQIMQEAVRKARVEALRTMKADIELARNAPDDDWTVDELVKYIGARADRLERDQPAASDRCDCDFSTDSPEIDPSCLTHGKNRPGQGMAEPAKCEECGESPCPLPESAKVKPSPTTEAPETIWVIHGHNDEKWRSGFWDLNPANWYKFVRADVVEKRVAETRRGLETLGLGREDTESVRKSLGAHDRELTPDAARRVVAERDAARREVMAMNNSVLESGKRAEAAERAADDYRMARGAALEALETAERERDEARAKLAEATNGLETIGKKALEWSKP